MFCPRHFAIGAGSKTNWFSCFLDIETLIFEKIRALHELIYKEGLAGVTRATVTDVFSNKDKNQSPVGYEAYDEITVCRQVQIVCDNFVFLQTCTYNA
jgi:hypothetical protein